MKVIINLIFLVVWGPTLLAQAPAYEEKDLNINKFIDGTLCLPSSTDPQNLVIFIQGSGPTDRNGNQPMMRNDGIKKLAHQLAEKGIASFRFDKRIFKMNELNLKEENLSFDDFVTDVKEILKYFKATAEYKNLIIAGHSQGSLTGMLAAQNGADAFISIAGAGNSIDEIIVEQVEKMAPPLAENARTAFDELGTNGSTTSYNPMLESIFRPSVQPFMYSWMKYDPKQEISKLKIPVLIINGTADIQVDVKEAEALKKANMQANLVILEDMNHIFRKIESKDKLVNTKSYNEPNLPLHPELLPIILEFINEIQ